MINKSSTVHMKFHIQELLRGVMTYNDDLGKQISRLIITVLSDEKLTKEIPMDSPIRGLGSQINSHFEIISSAIIGSPKPEGQKLNKPFFDAIDVLQPCFLKTVDVI